jgi:hypothetical protein
MAENDPELTSEDEVRALLQVAIPKLPQAISKIMLADGEVLAALGLPDGDFVRLWNRRFRRSDLFACLRGIANDTETSLASADGELHVEEAYLDEDGSAVLRIGTEGARFTNVRVLSDGLDCRRQGLDAIVANGEMSSEREAMWRSAIEIGPLDDVLFLALETEIGSSPEATFREMEHGIEEASATFDDLAPLDLNHYASLLGVFPPPATLGEFKAAWLDRAAQLDSVRLLRLLKLSGPLSVMSGALVAEASDRLTPEQRLALTQFLQACPDPFSVVAAFEIACRHKADPKLRPIADMLVPVLYNRSDALVEVAGMALAASATLTTHATARNRLLANWPLYAKRLARLIHAGHVVRVFRAANVDPELFNTEIAQSFAPQARLADLCDAREATIFQSHHLAPVLVHATMASRVTEAIAKIDDEDRPESWLKEGESAISSDIDSGWGLFLFAPGPVDEFEEKWRGLSVLQVESVEENRLMLEAADDPERCMSVLIKLSVAFEVPSEQRAEFGAVVPPSINRLNGTNFLLAAEIGLQLASRWRDEKLSDGILDVILARVRGEGLIDPGAAPLLIMLAAAAVEDPVLWRQRVGNIAQHFAYAQKPGPPSINLMRALELLRDFEPDLGAQIASAKSFTVLTFDRLPGNAEEEAPSAEAASH